eukprot:TRINITY_DN6127_c0_g1_i7.p1 TRINITY_DN6127_c0_g1~~TRINITY_DN6127_c0_g1_i7.p1  ORF type:complete len:302 (-),score=50.16 TRINITY_DN6127_c0_g1_i7:136-1041(-)
MMKICSYTHNAEKAKVLYGHLDNMPVLENCIPYNALIKALGSRESYAGEAIEVFNRMISLKVIPDSDSYVAVLKACAKIGDVKTAYNVLHYMRQQGLQPNVYIFNGLLRTYAGACASKDVALDVKEQYVKDAWSLFRQMQDEYKLPVNVNILNSLLLVHTKSFKVADVEGMVLPLYEKYGIALDQFTYEHLVDLYHAKRDFGPVFRLNDQLIAAGLTPSFNTLSNVLESAMRIANTDKIVEALQAFRKIGRQPKNIHLKRLGEGANMPDRVYLELMQFENKYGIIADKVYRTEKPNKYSPA